MYFTINSLEMIICIRNYYSCKICFHKFLLEGNTHFKGRLSRLYGIVSGKFLDLVICNWSFYRGGFSTSINMKNNSKIKKKVEKLKYVKETFSVVKFIDPGDGTKSFDCIPDLWFVNEEKNLCFRPPQSSKKSLTLRAMNQDIPDDDWEVYECEVVSEGHGKNLIIFVPIRCLV